MIEIVFATANKHKLSELRAILTEYKILSLNDIGFSEVIEEDGLTFQENAMIKARAVHLFCEKTTIADDSGLCVESLNGAPGVYSARYADTHGDDKKNNQKLLQEMKNVPEGKRDAKFVCAGAVVFEDGTQQSAYGEVSGRIAFEESGENGFGYDPLFICNETGQRYAQMDMNQKNEISHRRRAFEKLKPFIDKYYGEK